MIRVLQWNLNEIQSYGDKNKKMCRFMNLHFAGKTIGMKQPMIPL